jgi:hypothetical protein
MSAHAGTTTRVGTSHLKGPALVVACMAIGLGRAVATWPHYHVGSFDDDAGYVVVARALAHGHGLTSVLPAGVRLVAAYPPGYSALLAPIAWVSPTAFGTMRLTSLGVFLALFPLTGWYLRHRGVGQPATCFVLVLLALSPVLGTFAVMIMPEVAFVVAFLLTLVAIERWERADRVVTPAGLAVICGASCMLWMKEAAAGLVLGLVIWLVVRRMPRKAIVLAASSSILFLPVLVARRVEGTSLAGSRYSNEFGSAFSGGAFHLVAHAVSTYANVTFPQSLVPTSRSPLPTHGALAAALASFGTITAPLVLIGFVVWWRHHRDAASVAVPVYLAATLVYPFTNERRLVLVLPVVAAWYVLGWVAVVRWAAARVGRMWSYAWLCPAAALIVLVPQFGRDYLYSLGTDSSRPIGSPYMALLAQLGSPTDVVESDYVWTTALATGHRTAANAYYATTTLCYGPSIERSLLADDAGYLLSAALSNTRAPASACLLTFADTDPDAVRLLRTAYDDASVFELVGPGTPHADLTDLTAGVHPAGAAVGQVRAAPQASGDPAPPYAVSPAIHGRAVATWSWGYAARVSQVSVGTARPTGTGKVAGVEVQLRAPDGTWSTAASAPGGIGDGGAVPFLLQPKAQVVATAIRVVSLATGPVSLLDVHALGTNLTVQRTLRGRGVDNGGCNRPDQKEHCARTRPRG